jgi:beta-N-acetylhexosaminidase
VAGHSFPNLRYHASGMAKSDISAVGDHFMVGLRPTATLHPLDRALLADLRPVGVILFKSNFLHDQPYGVWADTYGRLIADVRGAVGRDRLLIGIDHEGGRVCRTPPPITRFAYADRWAAQADSVGRAMGSELASLGVNLDFAPVLDIHSNPSNPVIGPRAFGTTAEGVSKAALVFMAALQSQGVLACGKHFPGHGDTDKDSHRELPVSRRDLEGLRQRELKPFVAAIQAGVPMIMTSHVMLPEIDSASPATMSRRIIHDLLREELGFKGLIVSDDIGMHAVSRMFDDPSATVRLFGAGTDVMIICAHWTDTERVRGFAQTLLTALAKGKIAADWDTQSRKRIRDLLAHAPQNPVAPLSEAVLASHRTAGALFEADTAETV